MCKGELLDVLKNTKCETIPYFDLEDEVLNRTPGEGKWSIRQILHHLTDTEYLFTIHLKKIVAEPNQVIWELNKHPLTQSFHYVSAPLHGKKEIYAMSREMNYLLTDKYYDHFWDKLFIHSESGLCSLKEEFEKVATENQAHNEQIKIALER